MAEGFGRGGRGRSADPLLGEAPTPAPGLGLCGSEAGRGSCKGGSEWSERPAGPGRLCAPARGCRVRPPGSGILRGHGRAAHPSSCAVLLETRSDSAPNEPPLASQLDHDAFFFPARLGSHPGSLQSTQLQKGCSGHLTHVACSSPPATALGRPIRVLQMQNRALGAYRSLPRCEARAREGQARRPHRLALSTDWTAGVGTALHWDQPAMREVLENVLFQFFSDLGSPLERRDTQSVEVSGKLF